MSLIVITGPPCAGKTHWVMEKAGPQDIVIDFDRLAVALAGPGADSHQHPKHLRDVTFRARQGAILAGLQLARRATVYLIHAQPNARAMASYQQAGATVVTLDPGRDVVEARCRELRSPGTLAVVGKWYAARDQQLAESPPVTEPAPAPGTAATSRAW